MPQGRNPHVRPSVNAPVSLAKRCAGANRRLPAIGAASRSKTATEGAKPATERPIHPRATAAAQRRRDGRLRDRRRRKRPSLLRQPPRHPRHRRSAVRRAPSRAHARVPSFAHRTRTRTLCSKRSPRTCRRNAGCSPVPTESADKCQTIRRHICLNLQRRQIRPTPTLELRRKAIRDALAGQDNRT